MADTVSAALSPEEWMQGTRADEGTRVAFAPARQLQRPQGLPEPSELPPRGHSLGEVCWTHSRPSFQEPGEARP